MEWIVGGIAVVIAFFLGSWGARQAPLRAIAGQLEELAIEAQQEGAQFADIKLSSPQGALVRVSDLMHHCQRAGLKPEEVFQVAFKRARVLATSLTYLLRWLRDSS